MYHTTPGDFMDFIELTQTRRTIHRYKSEAVPQEIVEEALKLSLWAPNHKETHPWRYFWTGLQARAKLAELAVELKNAKEPLSDTKKKAVRDNLLNPAHLILLGIKKSEPGQQHEDYATLSCSVQIASLFLWSKGVGTKWSTGGATLHPKTYEILGVSPDSVQLEGALLVGVPDGIPRTPPRPPLSAHLVRLP
jgi:nitroreductase